MGMVSDPLLRAIQFDCNSLADRGSSPFLDRLRPARDQQLRAAGVHRIVGLFNWPRHGRYTYSRFPDGECIAFLVRPKDSNEEPRLYLSGGKSRGTEAPFDRAYLAAGLMLPPGSVLACADHSGTDLYGLRVDAHCAWGPEGERLRVRMAEASDADAMLDLLEQHLAHRMRARNRQPDQLARAAHRRLIASGGQVRIASIAAELSCSTRTLQRRFGESSGLRPKLMARSVRVREALYRLDRQRGEVDWATLAYAVGYCDQSHMIADFRDTIGQTPARLMAAFRSGSWIQSSYLVRPRAKRS
jgi:AraC-like DNA-binding protein